MIDGLRKVLCVTPYSNVWLRSSQVTQVVEKVVGERVRMRCVPSKIRERGELDRVGYEGL